MRTLYFDCFSGASGNMILAGLVAAGVDRTRLEVELRKLGIPDFSLEFQNVDRSGISALHVDVRVPSEHVHRHLNDIERIIDGSSLSNRVKERATSVFKRLALAESQIHGIEIQKVHFHEVGAMDAIIDVVGACIGFELLGIERFVCSRIHVGSGFAEMAHGKFPVPPPAVAALLTGVPIYSTEIVGELMTPTGAAIISTLCDSYGNIPEMTVERTAYGAGTREYDRFPNVLRLIVGTTTEISNDGNSQELMMIESNLDDTSPQVVGYAMERAFDLGALDCWITPIQMKKNRPGMMISILCEREKCTPLKQMVFRETSTIGIRTRTVVRECLDREIVSLETKFGEIDVKVARSNGKIVNIMPEFEHVRRAALIHNEAFGTVQQEVIEVFRTEQALRAEAAAK
jgi:uncharacterized protein (TIGR00299 family) protein